MSAAIVFCFVLRLARAGGPKCVAGTTIFDSTTTGQPLVWPQGLITYYTDQGDLSPILPNASANGSGRRVPSASGPSVSDGGSGRHQRRPTGRRCKRHECHPEFGRHDLHARRYSTDGDRHARRHRLRRRRFRHRRLDGKRRGRFQPVLLQCRFGGNDNYGSFATYQHALIVINGQCAQQSSQLTDVEYRLVRVIGSVLGLGWSQLNPNVLTGIAAMRRPTITRVSRSCTSPILRIAYPSRFVTPILTSCRWMMSRRSRGFILSRRRISRASPASRYFQRHGPHPRHRCGSPTLTEIGRRLCKASTSWRAGSIRTPVCPRAVCRLFGLRISVHRQRRQSHHGLRRRAGRSLRRMGIDQPDVEGFFDLAGLQLPNGTQRAISAERGSAQSALVCRASAPTRRVRSRLPDFAQPIVVTVYSWQ